MLCQSSTAFSKEFRVQAQIGQYAARGIMPGSAGDLTPGVRARTTQVKAGNGRGISRIAGQRPIREVLIRGYVQMADVPVGHADALFDVRRSKQ